MERYVEVCGLRNDGAKEVGAFDAGDLDTVLSAVVEGLGRGGQLVKISDRHAEVPQ
jgi:hypothetical protein